MQSYLFYDIETTGLNKSFDQILQFAAIRTDLELNELERHEIHVKLNPDVIPSPFAILTHHIRIQDMQQGISEYDALKRIHQWLNTPGTISLGYNTLGFDDEFLRFSFFRNLLAPYTHQYANQCGRMDLYPMALMYYLFNPSVIEWPTRENRPSLKLEDLNQTNQLAKGRAHTAMADVEATVALARAFIKTKDMWTYLTGYFQKQTDQTRTELLQPHMALLVDSYLGYKETFQCPVLFLGTHRYYKNQSLWLRLDTPFLSHATQENVTETTRVINKKPGEPNFILPFKEKYTEKLSEDRLTLAKTNYEWLKNHPERKELIYHYYANYTYPQLPNTDVEASLYLNGFWSYDETAWCQQFHRASPFEKVTLLQALKNPQLKELAIRLLGRHYPDTLKDDNLHRFSSYMQEINPKSIDHAVIDFKGNKRLTPQKALEEIQQLKSSPLNEEENCLIFEFETYLYKQFGVSL